LRHPDVFPTLRPSRCKGFPTENGIFQVSHLLSLNYPPQKHRSPEPVRRNGMPVMTLLFTLLSPEDFAIITAYSEIPDIPQQAKHHSSSVSP
jgi:hypothetical protein